MSHSNPSTDGERQDDDPYAPPRAETRPGVDEKETDQVGRQRREHMRRESCIRVAGILALVLAGYAVLTFVLVPLSELYDPDSLGEEGSVPWMYRRWVARSICDILIAVLAFVTSWALLRLRNWGRWAMTIVTTLPVPALLCGWLLLNRTANPGLQESLDPTGLTALTVMSALSCPLLLFLMWSPRGKTVFSPEYSETIRRTPGLRPGCSGLLPALAAVSAGLASHFVLFLTVLSILAMLGLIRSV